MNQKELAELAGDTIEHILAVVKLVRKINQMADRLICELSTWEHIAAVLEEECEASPAVQKEAGGSCA